MKGIRASVRGLPKGTFNAEIVGTDVTDLFAPYSSCCSLRPRDLQ
jgi:hypothetical protein